MTKPGMTDWLLLILLGSIWGVSFPAVTIALETVPPFTLVLGRLVIGALMMLGLMAIMGQKLPMAGKDWALLIPLALMGNALPFVLISWGQEQVEAGLSGILMAVMPLATLLLAHFIFHDEKLSAKRVFAFLLGFAGLLVLMGPEAWAELQKGQSDLISQIAIFMGAISYAFNAILARKAGHIHPVVTTAITLAIASMVILPFSLLLDQPWALSPDGSGLMAIGFLGVLATALATIIYFRLARKGAGFLSLTNYITPVVAVLTSLLFLAEAITANALIAMALIFIALLLSQQKPQDIAP